MPHVTYTAPTARRIYGGRFPGTLSGAARVDEVRASGLLGREQLQGQIALNRATGSQYLALKIGVN